MRADEERRIPVPAQRRLVLARLRLNAHRLTGAAIVADQRPVLRFGVDGVRVLRIDARMKTVAALGHEPIGVADAVHAARSGGTAEGEVILGAAVHVIEGGGVIDGDIVELRDGQIREELPVGALVERFVDAAVAADEVVVGVVGIDPDFMIVHMLPAFA